MEDRMPAGRQIGEHSLQVLEWEKMSPHLPRLWVPSWEQVHIRVPAQAPEEMPILTAAEARALAGRRLPTHRVRVRGHVVERRSGRELTIEDESGRIDARGLTSAGLARGVGLDLVGFLDVGRGFPANEFKLTTDDLKWGGGAGLIIQLFRAAIIGGTVGIGPENRLLALFHTSWTY